MKKGLELTEIDLMKCDCGHIHNAHEELQRWSPNITAGKCLILGCDCRYFCKVAPTPEEMFYKNNPN